ncbi:MAG: pilin [Candidatus Nealsonbacteria bacterium]
MKKIFLSFFAIILLFFPLISFAGGSYESEGKTIYYEGLIPCGKDGDILEPGESPEVAARCQLCHVFVMLDGIIDFLLFKIIPLVAVLMLVIGGAMLLFAGGNTNTFSTAKNIITSTVIGLVVIFSAWLIVNTIFMFIGLSQFGFSLTGPDKWSQINCEIHLPALSE